MNIYTVRNARTSEYIMIGQLMVEVYSGLEGFIKPQEQPRYYQQLANIGELTTRPGTEILVAVSETNSIVGAVVYFSDMKQYGSGGTATQEKEAAGFRFLAVAQTARGLGIGKLLTIACIDKAREQQQRQVIIHTTNAMKNAWAMYEKIGFQRSLDLDFMQGNLQVFGFRYRLN